MVCGLNLSYDGTQNKIQTNWNYLNLPHYNIIKLPLYFGLCVLFYDRWNKLIVLMRVKLHLFRLITNYELYIYLLLRSCNILNGMRRIQKLDFHRNDSRYIKLLKNIWCSRKFFKRQWRLEKRIIAFMIQFYCFPINQNTFKAVTFWIK